MSNTFESIEQRPNHQNPLRVEFRGMMKRDLFRIMMAEPNSFSGTAIEGASFLIFGGTLMFLAKEMGHKFPIHHQKSDDLDIGIYCPDNCHKSNDVITVGSPYLKRVIEKSNLTVEQVTSSSNESPLPSSFLVSRTFSRREIDQLIDALPKLIPYAYGLNDIKVLLEIDFNTNNLPLLLPPKQATYFSGSSTPILVDDIRNMAAKKLVRSGQISSKSPTGFVIRQPFIQDKDPTGFKPRDIIDLYNIINARPPMLDLVPDSHTSDLDLLRVLMIVNFAAMEKIPDRIDLDEFDFSDESYNAFRETMKGRIASSFNLDRPVVNHIFASIKGLYRAIFPEHDTELGAGSIKLTKNEKKFLEGVRGYRTLPGNTGTERIDPLIDVSLLKEDHPRAFAQSPVLEAMITNSKSLESVMENVQTTRSNQ